MAGGTGEARGRRPWSAGVVAAALLVGLDGGATAFEWDERLEGDLSGDRFAPTALALSPGANDLAMTSGSGGASVDRDYFRFRVPEGWSLASVGLVDAATDGVAFVSVQAGTQFVEPPLPTDVANLLGWRHFSGADAGLDLLPEIGMGAGAIGFVPPLPAGDYVWWAQDFGFAASYAMRFEVAPVPEPTGLAATLAGATSVAFAGACRRRMRGGRRPVSRPAPEWDRAALGFRASPRCP